MHVSLLLQPYPRNRRLHDVLASWLSSSDINSFVAISAWVNYRGLARIVPGLKELRSRGGTAAVVLGIDEGGATVQGLQLAAAEFDNAWVFHSNDTRTFHPKLYIASGDTSAHLCVGSNNLTPGGLFHNFEAALVIDLDLAIDEDRALLDRAVGVYMDILADTEVCKPLVPHLEEIIRDPTFRVRDENEPRRITAGRPANPDADALDPLVTLLFGRSGTALLPAVPPGEPIPGGPTRHRIPVPQPMRPSSPAGIPHGRVVRRIPTVLRRWFRELDATAAQHPPARSSNPTGNLRLSQAGHGIDQTRYFRNEFFGRARWTRTTTLRGVREAARVPREVVVDGRSLGTFDFEISHAPQRIAGQRNIPTVLHWGVLDPMLRAVDYSGRTVTIELLPRTRYRLSIDVAMTGPFVR